MIVFLCSGNVVRSAFAELYARHLGCPRPVCSAATHYRNTRIYAATAQALLHRGVEVATIRAFRPTHLDELRCRLPRRPLFFAMKLAHLEALPVELEERAFLLSEVLGSPEEIADPVEEGADFERVLRQITRCVEALVERLRSLSSKGR